MEGIPPEVVAIGVVLLVCGVLGYLAYRLKQPIIPAYIFGGLLIGPLGLRLVVSGEVIKTLSELTIIFVMFVIGLEMDVRKMRSVGSVVTWGGILQVVGTTILGTLIAKPWFGWVPSCYIGIAFSFGSTMLVIKVLGDRKALDGISGKITLGILLVQDIIAIMALSVLTVSSFDFNSVIDTMVSSAGLIAIGVTLGMYVYPLLFRSIANSPDLMMLFGLSICFAFAFFAAQQGLSPSIGAFITGISLANLPYGLEMTGRIKTLRDFFMPIFFASVGLQIVVPGRWMLVPILALTLATVTLKPLLISVIIACFGYRKRTAYSAANSLMPMSEFGMVIISLGVHNGHLGTDTMTMNIVVMSLTMVLFTYLSTAKMNEVVAGRLSFLDWFVRDKTKEDDLGSNGERTDYDIILLGCRRVGWRIVELAQETGKKILVAEIDPQRLQALRDNHVPCVYADVREAELWEKLGDLNGKVVISTIPHMPISLQLLGHLQDSYPNCTLVLSADETEDAALLYDGGAEWVLCPQHIAGKWLEEGARDLSFDPVKLKELGRVDHELLDQRIKRWHHGNNGHWG